MSIQPQRRQKKKIFVGNATHGESGVAVTRGMFSPQWPLYRDATLGKWKPNKCTNTQRTATYGAQPPAPSSYTERVKTMKMAR